MKWGNYLYWSTKFEAKEIKDIQPIEDTKVDKLTSTIICQTNHEDKDLDENFKESK